MTNADQRLLAFEIAGSLFALPIREVAEVAEVPEIAAVPMVSRATGGVVNHHGDALPVVFGSAVLGPVGASQPRHLLVLASDPDDPSRYGLPVDRIHGLVDGPGVRAHEPGRLVADRRPEDGRLMSVLDPEVLLERAVSAIEQSMTGNGPTHGGES